MTPNWAEGLVSPAGVQVAHAAGPRWVQRVGAFVSPAPRTVDLIIDVSLVLTAVLAVWTREVVMGFHVIFLLLAVGALTMSYRRFALRLVVGMALSSALVGWAVVALTVPGDELKELPLLTAVLVMIFLVAQARATASAEREAAHAELDRRADLALESMRQQLERSQRLDVLGRASTGLAHDLRNVFVVVRGCADDVARLGDHTLSEYARELVSATDRGVAIVDDLLWVGHQHDQEEAVADISDAIEQLGPMLQRLTRRRVTLTITTEPDLPAVRIDRISLTQILMNLVANASDAISARSGAVRVSARLRTRMSPGGEPYSTIVISVSDDGDGFSAETLSRAFDADFTTKGELHSGLGLTIVWQIADRFDGSVSLESGTGVGSTVTVSLPVTPEGSEPLAPAGLRDLRDRSSWDTTDPHPESLLGVRSPDAAGKGRATSGATSSPMTRKIDDDND